MTPQVPPAPPSTPPRTTQATFTPRFAGKNPEDARMVAQRQAYAKAGIKPRRRGAWP